MNDGEPGQLFSSQAVRRIAPQSLEQHIRKLHRGMTVTNGHHESLVVGYVNDLEWNFFDEIHRIYVHHTYSDMMKVFSGRDFSVNVVKWGGLPLFVQVANAKIDTGLFYQAMVIMGIIYCHQITKLTQQSDKVLITVDWFTASHWMFRPLHYWFNRRLLKLQRVQDAEDNENIRGRRFALRKSGVSFSTDHPDFLNSNVLSDNLRFPTTGSPWRRSIRDIPYDSLQRLKVGPVDLTIERRQSGDIKVWPAVCPHEGAELCPDKMNASGMIQCPWHGRQFRGVRLASEQGSLSLGNARVTLVDTDLVLTIVGDEALSGVGLSRTAPMGSPLDAR